MALETEGVVDVVGDEEEIVAETGESVVVPKGLPSPGLPSNAEVEHHNLTHLPYRSWCPFCVAARRKNNAHFANRGEGVQSLCSVPTIALSARLRTTRT